MRPDVDGVVVKGEKGGVQDSAKRLLRGTITAAEKVVVPHPGGQFEDGE